MGMSVWGLIAAPLMAPTGDTPHLDIAPAASAPVEIAHNIAADDIFAGDTLLDMSEMRDAAGGSNTAVNIGVIQRNVAENNGTVDNVNVANTTNGQIANNIIQDNDGLTASFNNTGNGVIQQATFQVNVFLGGAPAPVE